MVINTYILDRICNLHCTPSLFYNIFCSVNLYNIHLFVSGFILYYFNPVFKYKLVNFFKKNSKAAILPTLLSRYISGYLVFYKLHF